MSRKFVLLISALLLLAGLVIVGCSLTDPEEAPAPAPVQSAPTAPEKAAYSITLVPDGDVTNIGWAGFPDAVDSLYRFVDEGVGIPHDDLIYTHYQGATYRCTFTDMPTATDVDITAIEIQADAALNLADAMKIWAEMSIYVNSQLVGAHTFECGPMAYTECPGLDMSHVFDGLCLDAEDVNTLELRIYVNGIWWTPGMSGAEFYAIDAVVHYDEACDPEIQDLQVLRKGDNFAVIWDTPCDTASEVIWGYSPTALTNSVINAADTHHITNFTVAADEGCVYLKVISTGTTCSALADTSALQTSVKDVVISNVVRSFDAFDCTMTVTWDTNVKSSSLLHWGNSCGSLQNLEVGAGNTTSHSVTFDVSNINYKTRVYSVPESASGCDSALGACEFLSRNYCVGTP